MPDAVIHPTPQELAAFGLGKLSESAAAAIAAHLESCPACRQAVAGVSADSFLDKIRAAKQGDLSFAPSSAGQPSTPAVPCPNVPPELARHPKYLILRELGRGGMGVVYQARHKEMDRQVVIKVINRALLDRPESLERFRREIRAAAQLSHQNIVTAYDAERAGESHMLVMEFVSGQSLDEVLKKKGPLPVSVACHFARQVALGLQHAYERGMVHRDIKPQNLMLTPKGQVKILDFGLAKVVREENTSTGLTSENAYLGTPDYCAPEQATDARTADIRADLYSLGCTLYYLLSGRPPFREDTVVKTILAHQQKQPQPLTELRPEVPAEIWKVLTRLLAKEPAQRYEKPSEVAQALVPFIKSGSKQEAKAGSAPPQSTGSPGKGTVFELETSHDKKVPQDVSVTATPKEVPAKEEATSPFADLGVSASVKLTRAPKRKGRKGCVLTVAVSASLTLALILIASTMLKDNVQTRGTGEAMVSTDGKGKSPQTRDLERPIPDNKAASSALIDPEPYLFLSFHDQGDKDIPLPTMRFGLRARDPKHPDQPKKLTFDEHGRSNNTVLLVDGRQYLFGEPNPPKIGFDESDPPGKWLEMKAKLQGEIAGRPRDGLGSSWLLSGRNVKITQEVEIVPGQQSRRLDTCLVRYILKNRDTLPHQVGIRFMLDTFIGSNDGVPFAVPGSSELCDTEMTFNTSDRVPDFVQALERDDLRNPGTVAFLQFRVGENIEGPSRVHLGGWPNPELHKIGIQAARAQLTGWNVPFISMKERIGNGSMNDSAVTMYWNEQTLEPGKTRVVGFTYGLGNVDTRESGGDLLLTAGGRLVPNVDFSLMALVHDPKPDETLTLELPTGVEAAGQQMTRKVPAVPPGASRRDSPVTWRLRASKEGKYELTVRSSTGAKQKLPLTIRTRDMFD